MVTGYAVPGGSDGPVTKVEVSVDGMEPWTEAEFADKPGKWAWRIWRARLKATQGLQLRVYARAVDQGGNKQVAKPLWNLRGVAYNGYGKQGTSLCSNSQTRP